MGGNPFLGKFEGVDPEIETFLGPEMATSAASAIWAQKCCYGFPPLTIHSPATYKQQVH
jgi:hypothetical protein